MRIGRKALTLFLVASQDVLSTSSAFHGVALASSSGAAGRRHRQHVDQQLSSSTLAATCAANSLNEINNNKRGGGLNGLMRYFQRNRNSNNFLSTRGGSTATTAASSTALNSAVATDETTAPVEIFRKDYTPLPHVVSKIDMDFVINEGKTIVTSSLTIEPNDKYTGDSNDMVLDGDETCVKLLSITMNGKELLADKDYTLEPGKLILKSPPAGAVVETVVEIVPEDNTQLSGLYKSGPMYCTQCEAMGFRRITYYPDRPDNMAVFGRVRLEASKEEYPVLLANGNLIESGDMDDGTGRHYAVWSDPYPKPSYLFCCVAGNLGSIRDSFTTTSGRDVTLELFSEKENVGKLDYAMESLKRSMKWDQDRYGLEYDLDLYNIVAVDSFNMGAMENK